ncbi:hypothetical protein BGZ49_002330 [Haplosporangium sp. Z 27]|nr:hypothetical protein BGZ49_002330 [Haplosporangium sp. Z 27]
MSRSKTNNRISLEEFKSGSPGDLSPLAFVRWRAGAPQEKEKLHRAYVSLFTEAKTSPFPKIRTDGEEMERLWNNKGTSLQDYWATKSLIKLRTKNLVAAARNSSKLQIAVGNQQLKDGLRELQGQHLQQSQEGVPAQEQEQEPEQGQEQEPEQGQEQEPGQGQEQEPEQGHELLGNEHSSSPSDSNIQHFMSSSLSSLSKTDLCHGNTILAPSQEPVSVESQESTPGVNNIPEEDPFQFYEDEDQGDESVEPLPSSDIIFPTPIPTPLPTPLTSFSVSTSTSLPTPSPSSLFASTAEKRKSSTLEPPSPRSRKRAESDCVTLEPWRTLIRAVYLLVNGQKPVFPSPPIDMNQFHLLMFKHTCNLLTEYYEDGRKRKEGEEKEEKEEKDQTLLKDAMVVLSGVMNVMSDRFITFCEINSSMDIIDRATTATNINGFDEHKCLAVLRSYHAILEESGLEILWYQVVQDRSTILRKFWPGKPLPSDAVIEIKVLRILDYLCHIITNPPYKNLEPSENDCLLIWVHLFSLITDDIELLSGEKMLEASKAIRREQSREYGDLTEAGRKVDLALCHSGIELSSIEFKRAGIPHKEITKQCRKNIRLGRCLQEYHRSIGMNDLSVVMADITGFVGFFYHIVPFENVWTAGCATTDFVQLPTNEGALLAFMSKDETSLAQMFNFIGMLTDKSKLAKRAKQNYDLQLAKQTVRQASRSTKPFSPSPKIKSLDRSVMLSPIPPEEDDTQAARLTRKLIELFPSDQQRIVITGNEKSEKA